MSGSWEEYCKLVESMMERFELHCKIEEDRHLAISERLTTIDTKLFERDKRTKSVAGWIALAISLAVSTVVALVIHFA